MNINKKFSWLRRLIYERPKDASAEECARSLLDLLGVAKTPQQENIWWTLSAAYSRVDELTIKELFDLIYDLDVARCNSIFANGRVEPVSILNTSTYFLYLALRGNTEEYLKTLRDKLGEIIDKLNHDLFEKIRIEELEKFGQYVRPEICNQLLLNNIEDYYTVYQETKLAYRVMLQYQGYTFVGEILKFNADQREKQLGAEIFRRLNCFPNFQIS